MNNSISSSYQSYNILISEAPLFESWGKFGPGKKYSVIIEKDDEISKKEFFVPIAQDIKVDTEKVPDLIQNEVRIIINKNLFDDQDYQEYVLANRVFKNVTVQ